MMNTNFKWHYTSNMENMNPLQPPPQRFPEINQPQHYHAQYPHYQMHQNVNYQPPRQQNYSMPHHVKVVDQQNIMYRQYPQSNMELPVRPPQNFQQEQLRRQNMQNIQFYSQQQYRMPNPPPINQMPQQPPPQQYIQPQLLIDQKPIIHQSTNFQPSVNSPTLPFDLDFPINPNIDDELDINHFLKLDFADDCPTRKRKGNDGFYESQAKRAKRRTRAEMIEDKNRELMRQCKQSYVPLENLFVPNQVRIFGNCEYRHRDVRVHRMKLSPKNEEFHKVKNIGYLRTSNGTAYGCFIDSCRLKTYKKDYFLKHLEKYHAVEGTGSKEGYCQLCDKNNCGFGLAEEFLHMHTHHIDMPYEASHLILYSRLNNEMIRKTQEKRKKNRESKEQQSLERTLALFDVIEGKDNEEIYIPQEAIDDEKDNDYHPESEAESEEELPDVESDEDIDDSASLASSDMESEDLEDELAAILSNNDSDDSDDDQKVKQRSRKTKNEKDLNLVPCSQPSESISEQEKFLIHDIPQYMLQRIQMNAGNKNSSGPQFTDSFTSAIREMLEPETSKNNVESTSGFVSVEPDKLPKCSVRVKRLESCEDLKKYLSDEEAKMVKEKVQIPQNKETIESNKSVMPDIPTPPASEDSRDSMASPLVKEDKKIEDIEKIVNISLKLISKINFPSVSESNASEELKKPLNSIRTSLRDRRKSIAVSRNDEIYFRDDDVEISDTRPRTKSTHVPRAVYNDKEEPMVPPCSVKDVLDQLTENQTSKEPDKITSTEQPPTVGILKVRTDLTENSQKEETIKYSQMPSQSTIVSNDSQEVIEIVSSQEEIQILLDLQSFYPWVHRQISSSIVKSRKCIDILFKDNCLFSTYKCMKEKCSFFTPKINAFKKHAIKHDGDHHYCSFCLYDGVNGEDLSNHLESHDLDRYQCSKCMYRACEKMYVEWHRNKYHPNENAKILKSPIQMLGVKRREQMRSEVERENWMKFVHPYVCSTPYCNKKFFSKNNYRLHLVEESKKPNLSSYVQEISEQIFAIDHKRPFARKETKEGQFQCLFCLYGTDLRDEIQIHLSDFHASSLGFICMRSNDATLPLPEDLKTHTSIMYIGQSKNVRVKFYPENKSKEFLSSPDHLPACNNNYLQDEQNKTVSELNETFIHDDGDVAETSNDKSTSSTQNKIPVITEVIHIDSY